MSLKLTQPFLAFDSSLSMAIYHASHVMLHSPSDQMLWSGQVDSAWLGSPAFLTAQEHAIRTTALLQMLLMTDPENEELSQPVS